MKTNPISIGLLILVVTIINQIFRVEIHFLTFLLPILTLTFVILGTINQLRIRTFYKLYTKLQRQFATEVHTDRLDATLNWVDPLLQTKYPHFWQKAINTCLRKLHKEYAYYTERKDFNKRNEVFDNYMYILCWLDAFHSNNEKHLAKKLILNLKKGIRIHESQNFPKRH